MTSQIDTSKPVYGTPTTQSVRDNFATASSEITALQNSTSGAPFLPLVGGRMTGLMYLFGDPTDNLMPATKAYVDRLGPTVCLPLTGGTLTGDLTISKSNASLSLGNPAVVGTSYIDFNTSGFPNDRDARISVSGGTNTGVDRGIMVLSSLTVQSIGDFTAFGNLIAGRDIATTSTLIVNGAAGSNRLLSFNTASSPRWRMNANSAAEGAGNAGTDFAITRYDNTGVLLSTPLFISRATGLITTSGDPGGIICNRSTGALGGTLGSWDTVNAKGFGFRVDGSTGSVNIGPIDIAGNVTATSMILTPGGTMQVGAVSSTGTLSAANVATLSNTLRMDGAVGVGTRQIFFQTTGSVRWIAGVGGGAEGGNAGTDWILNRYSDTAVSLGSAISIVRATGACTIGGALTVTGIASKPGGGSWADSSDARAKDELGPYEHGLAEVLALRPIRYRFKDDFGGVGALPPDEPLQRPTTDDEDAPPPTPPTHTHGTVIAEGVEFVGLIAQEVEGVMPEMVGQTIGVIAGEQVDDLRTLDMTALPLALCNAVRELDTRLRALEGVPTR